MKTNRIILFLFILSLITFLSCDNKEERIYDYTQIEESSKKELNKKIEKDKEQYNSEGFSCWFVVWEVKGKSTKVNSFIMQPQKGFSMKEFKKEHGEDTFLVNLVEVSYGTYLLNTK